MKCVGGTGEAAAAAAIIGDIMTGAMVNEFVFHLIFDLASSEALLMVNFIVINEGGADGE
ncbi:hypothetical protein ACFELO_11850 [Oceanicaulis sp. LC35]|uniref:hypothetical protein n=1 Tax=Oceanicaulis sp. LC35 TaxID=3349635 RepID=UPI003F82D9C6